MIDVSEEENVRASGEKFLGDETTEDGCPVKNLNQSRKLTDEEITAQIITFLMAGYETTAKTMAYTSYLLALNPHIQEKLQLEIDNYLEEKPVSISKVITQ